MTPTEIQAVLAAAVEEVLDTMCFACVIESTAGAAPECAESTESPGAEATFQASLRFEGQLSGDFSVSVPGALARVIGAGFLGREEHEVSESDSGEVVGELANMFCGSVLSRIKSHELFRLSHPEVTRSFETGSPRGETGPPRGETRWFDLGDGILSVSFGIGQGT